MAFPQPATGRYVRFVCTPLEGKGMGLSELQVFDRATLVPWPVEIRLSDSEPPEKPGSP